MNIPAEIAFDHRLEIICKNCGHLITKANYPRHGKVMCNFPKYEFGAREGSCDRCGEPNEEFIEKIKSTHSFRVIEHLLDVNGDELSEREIFSTP